jgi:SAM-dependent methyltransferase
MYKLINGCRACGYGRGSGLSYIKDGKPSQKLVSVFNLGLQPMANDFKDDTEEHAGYAPLEVMFCPNCHLGQLSVVVRPDILYANYPYVTSRSHMMLNHFNRLIEDIRLEAPLKHVVEIGSNDGFFLNYCRERGSEYVLGVDPAQNLAEIAEASGVPTIVGLFTKGDIPALIHDKCVDPDVIVARHVFCHVDDWKGFIGGIEQLTTPETLVCIEVPYVDDFLKRGEFDTIYHEHLSYLSLRSVEQLLRGTGLHLHRVIHYTIHGGAVLLMLRRNDSGIPTHPIVQIELTSENVGLERWGEFGDSADREIVGLRAKVNDLVSKGHSVVGYGASAKATVWLNACWFTRKQIQFVADSTPQKQYKMMPGTNIPVVDEAALIRERPDYAILFAWNYAAEIMSKNTAYTDGGGKWIIPHNET